MTSVKISKDIEIAPSGSALFSSAPRAQPAMSLLSANLYVIAVSTVTNLHLDRFLGNQ